MPELTKEERLAKLRARGSGSEDYTDFRYYDTPVEVCDILIDTSLYRVPRSVGLDVRNILEDPSQNNTMIRLGETSCRAYLVKSLAFHQSRFTSLDEYWQRLVLKEQPKLFSEWEDKFSPDLKERIERIRLGDIDRALKALPMPAKDGKWLVAE